MMFRTHEVAGMVACTVALPILTKYGLANNMEVLDVGLVVAGGLVGAMLPDIDSPSSKIRRLVRKVFTGNPTPKKQVINHRREPHMPLVWAVIFAILFATIKPGIATTVLCGLAVGVFSHLLIDMFNPAGIPLFGPFKRKKISLLPIKTNSWGETVIGWLLVLLEIYLLFFTDSVAVFSSFINGILNL